jgi:hypothetical protein
MQEYRISNQELFDRNFIPHMLGWYLLTENTTPGEMEWMLARAAGYDAGFAMVARPDAIRANPLSSHLLDATWEWETARLSGAFSEGQKERLKNPKNEFHLEKVSGSQWNLYQYLVNGTFNFVKKVRQPGEPAYEKWDFSLESFEQPLQFKNDVTGTAGSVEKIKLLLDSYLEIQIPQELVCGETVICDGTTVLKVYDLNGRLKNGIDLPAGIPVMSVGSHELRFSCEFNGEQAPEVKAEVKSMGKGESITGAQK